mmetsp:Transcript_97138/g.274741  ORF Transcript_97138/g.274741 Transcript_97138/m.274741 type:complete len:239 (+) Transcript_97138:1425-2141(+)
MRSTHPGGAGAHLPAGPEGPRAQGRPDLRGVDRHGHDHVRDLCDSLGRALQLRRCRAAVAGRAAEARQPLLHGGRCRGQPAQAVVGALPGPCHGGQRGGHDPARVTGACDQGALFQRLCQRHAGGETPGWPVCPDLLPDAMHLREFHPRGPLHPQHHGGRLLRETSGPADAALGRPARAPRCLRSHGRDRDARGLLAHDCEPRRNYAGDHEQRAPHPADHAGDHDLQADRRLPNTLGV